MASSHGPRIDILHKRKPVSVRLSEKARHLLQLWALEEGHSQAAVIETLVRREEERRDQEADERKKAARKG